MLAIIPESVNLVMPLIRGTNQPNPIRVTRSSPASHRRAVYTLACFFRRELRYDFVQYGYNGNDDDHSHVAWLWVHPEAVGCSKDFRIPCIGAACFRLRPVGYALQWVWIHPYWRRQSLLSGAWPIFLEEFGQFECERPLSEGMQRFLVRMESE